MSIKPFRFKQFIIEQDQCSMKIGTDGVLLGAWANMDGKERILDIGTGTGVIALMAAQRNSKAIISAVEIDKASAKQAQENAANSPFTNRVTIINTSIQDFTKTTDTPFDLIICNPPFFSGGTLSDNSNRNAVRHTIKLPTGELLLCAKRLLSENGQFALILPYIEGLRFKERAEQCGIYCSRVTEVKPKKDKSVERLLMSFGRKKVETEQDSMVIQYEKRNDYTPEYVALTKDFYLKM